jgi:hypothetical protein
MVAKIAGLPDVPVLLSPLKVYSSEIQTPSAICRIFHQAFLLIVENLIIQ